MKKILFASISILFTVCAFAQVKSVSAVEFKKKITLTKNEQLIDVRSPQEFREYRIAGAKNIEFRNDDFQKRIEHLDKDKPVLVYCLRGIRSRYAMDILREAGFKIVYELEGGLIAWIRAEKAVEWL